MTLPLEPHTDAELAAMKRWAGTAPAPESFDATAALRRVLALAEELEAEARASNFWEGPAERAAARRIRAAVTSPADTTERDGER